MISNIIDSRTRPYRWRRVNAIVEATWHDNSVADSDQAEVVRDDREVVYQERNGVSLAEAVAWANAQPCPVTLYLYDEGAEG
jgi:hypothetical protein